MNDVSGMSGSVGHSRPVVVTALGFTQILGYGTSFYLLAVLAAPIARETGWDLPQIAAGLSIGLFVGGLAAPMIGRLVDGFGGRPVLAVRFDLLCCRTGRSRNGNQYPRLLARLVCDRPRHGRRTLRCGLFRTRSLVPGGRTAADHDRNAVGRICIDLVLAAQRLSGRQCRLALDLPDFRGRPSVARAAASCVAHAAQRSAAAAGHRPQQRT